MYLLVLFMGFVAFIYKNIFVTIFQVQFPAPVL